MHAAEVAAGLEQIGFGIVSQVIWEEPRLQVPRARGRTAPLAGLGRPTMRRQAPAQLDLTKLYVPSQFHPFVTEELAVTVTLAWNPVKVPVPPEIVHSPRPSAKPR